MSVLYVIRILCVVVVSTSIILCENEKDKRLVLHSETDLLQEFTKLRSEFESYKSVSTSEINGLKSINNQLTSAVTALQTANNHITLEISTIQNAAALGKHTLIVIKHNISCTFTYFSL